MALKIFVKKGMSPGLVFMGDNSSLKGLNPGTVYWMDRTFLHVYLLFKL